METLDKHVPKQLKPFLWPKGISGNPNGRPKGKTLKEFAREYLLTLPDDEKLDYLASLPPEIVWYMAEGRASEDKKISIVVPKPILGATSQPAALDAPDSTAQIQDAVAQEVLEDTSAHE